MKISLCLEPVFESVDFYDRIALAKQTGVDAVEFWDPIDKDAAKVQQALSSADIPVAAITLNNGWGLRLNDSREKVLANLQKTIDFCSIIGCPTIIGLGGEVECKADSQKSILIENLKYAADVCAKAEVTLALEALNSLYDHKGYYLDSSYIGFEIIKCVNNPYIKLLYDCYHMQIMEGNLINSLTHNVEYVGHIHAAGVPGRHELFKGETDYPYVFKAVENAGYDRYYGLEYWPTYDDAQSVADTVRHLKEK